MDDKLELYKSTIKNNIETLVNAGNLAEAKELLNDYTNAVKDDADIYSIKGVLAIMEQQYDKAEEYLKEGLKFQKSNFDINYNLAYIYQNTERTQLAIKYYRKSLLYTKNEKNIEIIESNLKTLEDSMKSNKYVSNLPKVTILIPTYNQKKFLQQAVDSCLQQDYENIQIIVVDDCSTDGTDVAMRGYLNNERVRYIRNKVNIGPGNNTKNFIYTYPDIDTKYMMMLNHDDYLIYSGYINEAVEIMEKDSEISFVWANTKTLNEKSGTFTQSSYDNPLKTNGFDYFLNYETEKYPHITGLLTTVFNLEKLKSTGYGEELTKSKDTFMYLKLMLVGDVGFINKYASVYRIHNNSLSYNMPLEFDESTIAEFEKLKNLVLKSRIVDKKIMNIWVNNRIFTYVLWRFRVLWNKNNKREAIKILVKISSKYNLAYEKILEII